MKPTKQTVYLAIDEEWEENKPTLMSSDGEYVCNLHSKEGYFFTPEQLNEYTANIIKHALETAAEKADTCIEKGFIDEYRVVDKQSITNTFEETFKKFEI